MTHHSDHEAIDDQDSGSRGTSDSQTDSTSDQPPVESSEGVSTEDQLDSQSALSLLSRRTMLGSLIGLGGLSMASSPAAAGGTKTWKKDRDADGNDLLNLGALTMQDNTTEITDFTGANLGVANGKLSAAQWNKDVDAGGNDLSALGSVSASEVNTDALSDNGAGDVTLLTGVDAGGNDLFDLGGLRMRGKSTPITDFEGTGLSVDDSGVLNTTTASPWADGDGDGLLEASEFDGIDVNTVKAGSVETPKIGTDLDVNGDVSVSGSMNVGKVGVSAFLEDNQTIPTTTFTTVEYDATNRDDFGGHDKSTGKYTVKKDGDYHVSFKVDWISRFDEGVLIDHALYLNGFPDDGGLFARFRAGTDKAEIARCYSRTLFDLNAGDTLSVVVKQNSGEDKTLHGRADSQPNYLTIHKVG